MDKNPQLRSLLLNEEAKSEKHESCWLLVTFGWAINRVAEGSSMRVEQRRKMHTRCGRQSTTRHTTTWVRKVEVEAHWTARTNWTTFKNLRNRSLIHIRAIRRCITRTLLNQRLPQAKFVAVAYCITCYKEADSIYGENGVATRDYTRRPVRFFSSPRERLTWRGLNIRDDRGSRIVHEEHEAPGFFTLLHL